jgi:hypothetical protein
VVLDGVLALEVAVLAMWLVGVAVDHRSPQVEALVN